MRNLAENSVHDKTMEKLTENSIPVDEVAQLKHTDETKARSLQGLQEQLALAKKRVVKAEAQYPSTVLDKGIVGLERKVPHHEVQKWRRKVRDVEQAIKVLQQ